MDINSVFSAGPRLADPPAGDPKTQAIASLRGYAYQLYTSGLAWLGLKPGEDLYLEVARDYAVSARHALAATEVKDTAGRAITINSESVREALDAFVDLVERNPNRDIQFHFLTTSSIGKERKNTDRIEDEATLRYWRRAAAGADMVPLREILTRIDLTQRVHAFIKDRDDATLRREFLRRIHWDCGKPDLENVVAELGSNLLRLGIERLRAHPTDKDRLLAHVLVALLDTVLKPGPRRLTDADLLEVLGKASSVTLPRQDFDVLLRTATEQLAGNDGRSVQATLVRRSFEPEADLPLPEILAERKELVADVLALTRNHGACLVTGGTGSGKTTVARLAARSHGGSWHLLDCRDTHGDAAIELLELALTSLDVSKPVGVILDDINELEDARVRRAAVQLLAALRRRDTLCVITAYNEPSARAFSDLGIGRAAHRPVPDLTIDEIAGMVTAAGGDAAKWAAPVRLVSSFGHPQLVQAVISGLRLRSWPTNELHRLQALEPSEDVKSERIATRRRLMSELPNEARSLLYRLTLVLGRFDRPLAVALGSIEPEVPAPGAQLDGLIGPWIEQMGRGELRMSPLVQRAGVEVLALKEQELIHKAIAEHLGSDHALGVDKADLTFAHALLGRAERILTKLAYGIIGAKQAERRQLVDWITGLRLHRLDRPIYADDPSLSATLRCAQVLLITAQGEPERIKRCWIVLKKELQQLPDETHRRYLEILVTGKVLIEDGAAGILPNWIDLLFAFETQLKAMPTVQKAFVSMPVLGKQASITPLGVLFSVQLAGIRSVAGLAETFSRLDTLTPVQRDTLFADALRTPKHFSIYVNRAWLQESKQQNPNWRASADAYKRMAEQAQSWGYRDLALRCHVARAILLDEYTNNAPEAEQALKEARDLLGDDPVLVRAHAKILFRHKDHVSALDFLRRIASEPQLDAPIERAFLAREAAICAAEIGEWPEAQRWFAVARTAAEAGHLPAMDVMAIGLQADGALAAFKSGDTRTALEGLDASLERLSTLDPNSSLAAGYCHRVIRHSLLWFLGQLTGEPFVVQSEPAAMLPGMCSNTEPPDMKDLPLGSLDYARYLVARAEVASGLTVGIQNALRTRLEGRAIPSMEIFLERERMSFYIRSNDVDRFLEHLPRWVDCQLYLNSHREHLTVHGPLNPYYGEILAASSDELNSSFAANITEDAFLSFGMVAALHSRREVLPLLHSSAGGELSGYPPTPIIKILLTGSGPKSRLVDVVAQLINNVLQRADLTPSELFTFTLKSVHWLDGSNFKALLTPMLVGWVHDRWSRVITTQRFYLRAPATTAPELQAALDSSNTGLAFIGNVLLVASNAVGRNLDSQYRDFLMTLPS